MNRLEAMSPAEWAEHLRSLEEDWRPQRVHSDHVERWLVVKYGPVGSPTQTAAGLVFSSHEAAYEAARGLNIAARCASSARTAGWVVA